MSPIKTRSAEQLVRWKAGQERLIERYLGEFMSILTIRDNGEVTTTEIFMSDVYLKILTQNIILTDVSSPLSAKRIINTSIHQIRRRQNQNLQTFRYVLASQVRRYHTRPINQYQIIFPLDVQPGQFDRFRQFSLLDIHLHPKSWSFVREHFEFDRFLQDLHLRRPNFEGTLFSHFTPFLVNSNGRDEREAFEKADRSFELFRTLLNLIPQFGRITMRWADYPTPLATILPPPVFGFFDQAGKFVELYYNTQIYNYRWPNFIPADQIKGARILANRLRHPNDKKDTILLFTESLEKYGQALDSSEWRLAFLTLWQILELITLQSSDELNMKQVVNRTNGLLRQNQLAGDLLFALYETRNQLVHLGQFPDEQGLPEVNFLKYIVERAINAFFAKLRIVHTKSSLARYYDYQLTNDTELADRQRIIEAIRRLRRRR